MFLRVDIDGSGRDPVVVMSHMPLHVPRFQELSLKEALALGLDIVNGTRELPF